MIWGMPSQKMGGRRSYLTDFEVYDERATDHQRIVLDLYVGLCSKVYQAAFLRPISEIYTKQLLNHFVYICIVI
jgi:hypothetical protein